MSAALKCGAVGNVALGLVWETPVSDPQEHAAVVWAHRRHIELSVLVEVGERERFGIQQRRLKERVELRDRIRPDRAEHDRYGSGTGP